MSNQKLNLIQSKDKQRIVLFLQVSDDFLEVRFSELENVQSLASEISQYVDVFSIGVPNEKKSTIIDVANVFIEKGIIKLPNLTVIGGL